MIKDIETFIESGTEHQMYFLIDHIGAFTWRMNHDMSHGRIDEKEHAGINKEIEKARAEQLLLVRSLPRFGVDTPLDAEGRPTEQYWRWFRWWDSWKKNLTDDEWRTLDAAFARGLSADESIRFRPQGDWRTEAELTVRSSN